MKIYNFLTKISFAIAMAFVLVACSDDEDTSQYEQTNLRDMTVSEYVQRGSNTQGGSYNTLNAAIDKAGIRASLEAGNVTLFAPTDAAFEAAGIDIRDIDAAELADILTYHVADGSILSTDLGAAVATLNGSSIIVNGECLNGSTAFASAGKDVNLSNGVIHSIDNILIPPTGDITAKINEFATATDAELTLLQNAIVKAGLDATLSSNASFTLFAPTDAAMTAAGLDQTAIDAATVQELQDILLYHVLSGAVLTCGVVEGRTETAKGPLTSEKGVDITIGDDGVEVEGAVVETADIIADNGVIHIVDAVVFPKQTIIEALEQPNIGFFQYYRTHRFFEILAKSGITYDLNDKIYLLVPSTFALDTYLDNLGTDVATLTPAECADIVNFHTFSGPYTDFVSETYVSNENGTGSFLFNSNSDGDFLNLQYNAYGFATLDGSFILDTDRSGLGFGILAGTSWQNEELYNGVVTTVTSVLEDAPANSILDELTANGNYTTLLAGLAAEPELADAVNNDNITFFAPTDAAFDSLGIDDTNIATVANLKEILENHMVTNLLPVTNILDAGSVTTVSGLTINLAISGGVKITNNTLITSDDVVIASPDQVLANGVLHGGLDKVLSKPSEN